VGGKRGSPEEKKGEKGRGLLKNQNEGRRKGKKKISTKKR